MIGIKTVMVIAMWLSLLYGLYRLLSWLLIGITWLIAAKCAVGLVLIGFLLWCLFMFAMMNSNWMP